MTMKWGLRVFNKFCALPADIAYRQCRRRPRRKFQKDLSLEDKTELAVPLETPRRLLTLRMC